MGIVPYQFNCLHEGCCCKYFMAATIKLSRIQRVELCLDTVSTCVRGHQKLVRSLTVIAATGSYLVTNCQAQNFTTREYVPKLSRVKGGVNGDGVASNKLSNL